jgi:hypothetical protein
MVLIAFVLLGTSASLRAQNYNPNNYDSGYIMSAIKTPHSRFAFLLPPFNPLRDETPSRGQFGSPQLPRFVCLRKSFGNLRIFSIRDLNCDTNGQSASLHSFDECDFLVLDQVNDAGNVHTFHSDLSGDVRNVISALAKASNFAEDTRSLEHVFVIGALIDVLKASPPADIVDKQSGEICPLAFHVRHQLIEALAASNVQTTSSVIRVFLNNFHIVRGSVGPPPVDFQENTAGAQ